MAKISDKLAQTLWTVARSGNNGQACATITGKATLTAYTRKEEQGRKVFCVCVARVGWRAFEIDLSEMGADGELQTPLTTEEVCHLWLVKPI